MNGEITRKRRRAVAAAVAGALVVAGTAFFLFSGNGSGSAAPAPVTPTSAPPSSASPTPSQTKVEAPVLPAAAKEPTTKGAAAFFRYFWETFNYSYRALDTAGLDDLSEKSCRSCTSYIAAIEAARDEGNRFTGGEVQVLAAVAAPGDVERGLVVNAVISQEPAFTITPGGATATSADATAQQRIDAAVAWRDGRWVMLGMDSREK